MNPNEDGHNYVDRSNALIASSKEKFEKAARNYVALPDDCPVDDLRIVFVELSACSKEYVRLVEEYVAHHGNTVGVEYERWRHDATKSAVQVLSALPKFYLKLRSRRDKLEYNEDSFEPSAGAFQNMQALVASVRPEMVCELREQFVKVNLPVDGFSHPYCPRPVSDSPVNVKVDGPQEVVLLIHGIRTDAAWAEMVSSILESRPQRIVVPLRYGYFDAFRFWCPIYFRAKTISTILWRLRSAQLRYQGAKLSVVAHSFGTYAIGSILKDNTDICLNRLILCGSILDTNFKWDLLHGRVSHEVVNECGTKDRWPIIAQSCSWGFGASGTFGFGFPGVYDRFHDHGHSEYLEKTFVERFWLPIFQGTSFKRSTHDLTRKAGGWTWAVLRGLPFKYLIAFIAVVTLGLLLWRLPGFLAWIWSLVSSLF